VIENAEVGVEHGGERMAPESSAADTFWEHVYRYRFAARFVRGRRALDIACGEGYGTASLAAAGAASVVGIDASPEACEHARRKYRVDARAGRAEDIPLPDESVDVVVSFETIEHVEEPRRFVEECHRVLSPGGTLIVSTPNRPVYSPQGKHNRFHVSEMDEEEFRSLLETRFPSCEPYVQRLTAARWSPRVFGADGSPWARYRVWRAFVGALRLVLCPRVRGAVAPKWRSAPVQAVLADECRVGAFANPFVVRKRAARHDERPAYLIVVASKSPA
jgi:ubiquinone/menaquinone biosynthesis C-methylase UbiE